MSAHRITAPPGAVSGAFVLGERRAAKSRGPMFIGDPIPEADAELLRENFGQITGALEAAYRDGHHAGRMGRRGD